MHSGRASEGDAVTGLGEGSMGKVLVNGYSGGFDLSRWSGPAAQS